jgi:cytosine/adenosine deaminase-related metal-dependent hydrolase
MGINIKRAAAATALAASVVAGSLLAAAPAQAATASSHVVNQIRETAKVHGHKYTVDFVVKQNKAQVNSCTLKVVSPKHNVLYSTNLTGGQCWAVHTIWTQREEPRYFRAFDSKAQLLHTVRAEVREGKTFDRQLNS